MKRPLYYNSVFRVVPARTWWQERSDTGLCPSALSSTASSFTSFSTAAAHDGEKLVKIVRFLIKHSEFQLQTQKTCQMALFTFSDALIWQDFSPSKLLHICIRFHPDFLTRFSPSCSLSSSLNSHRGHHQIFRTITTMEALSCTLISTDTISAASNEKSSSSAKI